MSKVSIDGVAVWKFVDPVRLISFYTTANNSEIQIGILLEKKILVKIKKKKALG